MSEYLPGYTTEYELGVQSLVSVSMDTETLKLDITII